MNFDIFIPGVWPNINEKLHQLGLPKWYTQT